MTQLLLFLLGPFQAKIDDEIVSAFESDKARALLSYLAVESAVPHPRSQIAGLLWPDWSESQARANLRHTLATLRTSIGDRKVTPSFLLTNHQTIQMNAAGNVWLDVTEFDLLIDTFNASKRNRLDSESICNLEQAVRLYQGPFLDGFALKDCADFESWLLLTRTRLERKAQAALRSLADIYLKQGKYEKAQGYTQQQIDLNPLQEDAYFQGMQTLALMGERTAALALYERCRGTLAKELGVEPSKEVTQLHQQIQGGQLVPATGPVSPQMTSSPMRSPVVDLLHRPTQSSHQPQHNLPAPTTSFVGRDYEQKTITDLLHRPDVRLVTLHGPGGVGKTRLAQEVARQLADNFLDGIHWVDLVPLRSPADVVNALASALGVRETASQTLDSALKAYLRDRDLLLLLDNFEHLLEVAPLVADLLAHAPALNILITSREVLHLYGEYEVPVEPLPTANWTDPDSDPVIAISQSGALQLFAQRAEAVIPNFQVNQDNVATIAKICWQLDGLPLALELAAAQLKYFTPEQLLGQLQDPQPTPHRLLKSAVQRPARHQSLTAAIRWSYQLLSPEEQHVFRRCAIFVGSFGLDALAAICSPIHERDVQNSLFALVDKNLVRYVEASAQDTQISEPRFGLLETIREFGVATLLELDELERTQRAYANCYLVLAEALSTDLQTRQASQANTLLTLERANVRAVMRWVLDLQALEIGFRLANALWTFWTQRGGLTEAYPWFEQLLAQAEGEPPSPNYCAALYAAGFAARHSGNLPQAQRYTECCLTMSQTLGDKEHIGLSLAMLCSHAFHQGNYAESRRLGLESLQLRREQGSEWQTAMILLNLGFRETKMGNFEQARLYLEEGLAYQQKIETGDFGMAVAWTWLGQLARWEGDYQGARALQMKSKQLCERSNLPSIYAHTCCELAWLQMLANRYDDAKHAIDEALITCDAQNNKGAMWEVFCPLIGLYAAQGMFEETLTYAAFLTQFLNELGMVLPPVNREQFDRDVAAAKRSLPEEDAATAWAAGEGMPLAHAVASV